MCYPPSMSRVTTKKYATMRDVPDLVDALGGEAIIAAHILKQAVDDWRDVRAGKKFDFAHPYRTYAQREIENFFAGEWFAFLAAHLGFDRATLLRMLDA